MKSFLLIFYICISKFSFSQNLLVNGDFEDENICTEYHVNCSPDGWVATTDAYNNLFQIPGLAHRGQHCVTIAAGNSKKQFCRTYIRTQLLCHLRKGNKYNLQFYIRSKHNLLDSIGIYFTSYDFLFEKQVRYKIIPTVYLADAQLRPQPGDTNWQKVSVSFIASGTEVYLTLGNFSKRDITGLTYVPSENNFFVWIDDISLLPEDAHEIICKNWQATKEEIYGFHERHQFLDLYIKRHGGAPLEAPEMGKTAMQKIDSITLPDIFFEVNRSALSAKSLHVLDSLLGILNGSQIDSLVIEGHTDNTGTDEYNQKLSLERAMAVADYMNKILMLEKDAVVTRGWGGKKPVADNLTSAGRQRNRRVEIFIYIRE